MSERQDRLWKPGAASQEEIEKLVETSSNPIGLDVGTSKIAVARKTGNDVKASSELNAFFQVPHSRFTEKILEQNQITNYREGDELVIYGTATERFANMFNAEARRPMADGLLNPRERAAMSVIEAILKQMLPRAATKGEALSFSVPAPANGKEAELTYHEASMRRVFEGYGYDALAINEGLAVVFAELENENFTGVGISCGGGMCNVTLAFLSIPSIMFSITKGGDFIDASAGSVLAEQATRIKVIKEEGLDLSRSPRNKYEKALQIYYEDLIHSLVGALKQSLNRAEQLPRADRPLPIVLSGGAAKPKGFRDLFEKAVRGTSLPIEISEVRMAADPLTTTARGALIAALYEK